MREALTNLPKPIKRLILWRCGIAFAALVLFAVLLGITKDFILALPCIILSLFLIVSCGILFINYCEGNVICLDCICVNLEYTILRNRIKAFQVETDCRTIRFLTRRRLRNLQIGDKFTIYLSKKTPVYERDGVDVICEFYTIEKTVETNS